MFPVIPRMRTTTADYADALRAPLMTQYSVTLWWREAPSA